MRMAQPRDRGETVSNRRVARITLTEQVACRKAARQAPESRVRLWPSPACTGRLAAKPEALNMAALHEALEQVLAANPGKNYCPRCLAKAAGFTLPEEGIPVATLMRSVYSKATDRVVENGLCAAGCGKTDLIVRYTG